MIRDVALRGITDVPCWHVAPKMTKKMSPNLGRKIEPLPLESFSSCSLMSIENGMGKILKIWKIKLQFSNRSANISIPRPLQCKGMWPLVQRGQPGNTKRMCRMAASTRCQCRIILVHEKRNAIQSVLALLCTEWLVLVRQSWIAAMHPIQHLCALVRRPYHCAVCKFEKITNKYSNQMKNVFCLASNRLSHHFCSPTNWPPNNLPMHSNSPLNIRWAHD